MLLAWVYYSAQIVFLGAEIVQAWAAFRGEAIVPEAHAESASEPHPQVDTLPKAVDKVPDAVHAGTAGT